MLMVKRLYALVLTVLLLCSTELASYAASVPDLSEKGAISLTMRYGDHIVPGGEMTLYQAAALEESSGKFSYVLTEVFSGCGIVPEQSDFAQLAGSLSSYVRANGLTGRTKQIGNDGQIEFDNLTPGLYLIIQNKPAKGYYAASPFVVSVPMNDNGEYVYMVNASPKVELVKEDGGSDDPEPSKPTPSEPNPPEPTPIEPSKPDYPQSDTPENPPGPGGGEDPPIRIQKLPQTGQLNWPVPVLVILGLGLFAVGWILRFGKKKENYEE